MRFELGSSIRWKILVVVVLGLILPASAAAWLSYQNAYEIIYGQSISHQSRILDQLNQELLILQDRSRQQIQALARNPLLISALDQEAPMPEEFLRNNLQLNPEWNELIIFDRSAREIWPSQPGRSESFDPFFLETFLTRFNQGPVFQSDEDYLTRFGASIWQGADFRGVISVALKLTRFERRLRALRQRDLTGAVLWDDRGIAFASNLSPSEWRQVTEQISLESARDEMLRSLRSQSHRELIVDGKPMLFLATLVPEFISRIQPLAGENWYLATLTPTSEAFGELRQFQASIATLLMLLALAVVMVTFWLTLKISRPLEEMAVFADRVSEGERRVRLREKGKDEVGRLSTALNSMTESLRTSERELVRSETLASLGRMSSILAHEIRNPLNAIRGSVQYLELQRPDDEVISEYSQIILEKISSLTQFVESLLKLSRFPEPDLAMVSLQTLVDNARMPLDDRLKAGKVELMVKRSTEDSLFCDPEQISEMLQNLIQNALEAMPDGGKVEIEARRRDEFDEVVISDTGPGIDPKIQERLFVPFTTGKAYGNGLGLVLCRMIAEGHGGSLENLPSEKGACFLLRLPAPASVAKE